MSLFQLFTKRAPNKVFISLILGGLAGISYALLIPIILNSQDKYASSLLESKMINGVFFGFEVSNINLASLFFATCFFILFTRSISQIMLVQVAMDTTSSIRTSLYNLISKASIEELEKYGGPKLVAAITTDVSQIVAGARVIPDLLISSITLLGMLSFLLYINIDVFLLVMVAIIIGGISFQIPMYFGNKYFAKSRRNIDLLVEAINGLIYGAKELKLSKTKQDTYINEVLLRSEKSVVNTNKKGNTIVTAATNYGDLISFFVIGIVGFIFVNYHAVSSSEQIGIIMALLYITGPVAIIINAVPQIIVARISLNKVNMLMQKLPVEEISEEIYELPQWSKMTLTNLEYNYTNELSDFSVGPINVEISKGEITFIVGGNGSGKSTLGKLLTLHYAPQKGEIKFGDTILNGENKNSCRQFISAIFTDFYLFDRLLAGVDDSNAPLISQYLEELKLSKKVTIKNGRFSTTLLSDGQKKRLALLGAFLEDREIYVFDEWAADQDPVFKQVFYENILPDLKRMNKAVIVITHDDRYFHLADKLVRMVEGKIVSVEDQTVNSEVSENNLGCILDASSNVF